MTPLCFIYKSKHCWLFFLLLGLLSCRKGFDIDPNDVYSPAELVKKTQGKCKNNQPWEGKPITVSGLISQPKNGRFLLSDEQTQASITVVMAIADTSIVTQTTAMLQANWSKMATVTGIARAESFATQFKCRQVITIEINDQNAIKL